MKILSFTGGFVVALVFSAVFFGWFGQRIMESTYDTAISHQKICREDHGFCVDLVNVREGIFDPIVTPYVFFIKTPERSDGVSYIKFDPVGRVDVYFGLDGGLSIEHPNGARYSTIGEIPDNVAIFTER